MTAGDKFQIAGDNLIGRGLSFSVASFGPSKAELEATLVDVAEAIYQQGRDSALLSRDDRFDLYNAAEALRALAVLLGPVVTADRYNRAADAIAQLLQKQDR